MAKYLALLRGINVGGQKIIKMADLAKIFSGMGFAAVQTYIQSGNVIFECPQKDAAALTAKIERGLRAKLGYDVPVILRTAEEFAAVAASDPLRKEPLRAAGKYYIAFLSAPPEPARARELESRSNQWEVFRVRGREAFVLITPDPKKSLTFGGNVVEKLLGVRATARNRKVVGELAELLTSAKTIAEKTPKARRSAPRPAPNRNR